MWGVDTFHSELCSWATDSWHLLKMRKEIWLTPKRVGTKDNHRIQESLAQSCYKSMTSVPHHRLALMIKAAGVELLTQESSKVWVDDACGNSPARFQAGHKVMLFVHVVSYHLLTVCWVAGVSVLIIIQQRRYWECRDDKVQFQPSRGWQSKEKLRQP